MKRTANVVRRSSKYAHAKSILLFNFLKRYAARGSVILYIPIYIRSRVRASAGVNTSSACS